MFTVFGERERRLFAVYDVVYDTVTGYPQFLIHDDEQWRRVSAKYYKPHEPEEDPVLRILNKWECEELKKKYESDSMPGKRDKAFLDLQKYVADFVYDLHNGKL